MSAPITPSLSMRPSRTSRLTLSTSITTTPRQTSRSLVHILPEKPYDPVAVNQFADLTAEDFAHEYCGYYGNRTASPHVHTVSGKSAATVDWRSKGVVNPIKDQQSCGSCWAFSAIGSFESAYAIKTGKLVSLSEQQLVDCSTVSHGPLFCLISQSFGNEGCNGGLMDQAFQYIIQSSHGEDAETVYPYEARDGACRFKKADVAATMSKFVDIPANNEKALADAVRFSSHLLSVFRLPTLAPFRLLFAFPQTSSSTLVAFTTPSSAPALLLLSTTALLLSASTTLLPLPSGLSATRGAAAGARMATSAWPRTRTSAVLLMLLPTLLFKYLRSWYKASNAFHFSSTTFKIFLLYIFFNLSNTLFFASSFGLSSIGFATCNIFGGSTSPWNASTPDGRGVPSGRRVSAADGWTCPHRKLPFLSTNAFLISRNLAGMLEPLKYDKTSRTSLASSRTMAFM